MAVTSDIVQSYRAPRAVLRRLHGRPGERREARILVYLMLACVLICVAQGPRLAREAELDPSVPLEARLAGALFAWVFIAPLLFYVLAGFLALIGRIAGKVDGFSVRLALFWALLVASPVVLLQGLVSGLIGQGIEAAAVFLVAAAVFCWVLVAGLRVAYEGPDPARPL